MKTLATACALATLTAAPSVALAEPNGSQSIRVSARVSAHCEINVAPILAPSGAGVVNASVFESCNSQDGFQVAASYRALAPGEAVQVSYAGQTTTLHQDGWSEVANRTGATYGARPLDIQYRGLATPLAINLTVTSF